MTGAGVASAAPGKAPRALKDYPTPPVSGKQIADGVDAFATTFARRVTGTPAQSAATTSLRDELVSLGYAVQVQTYRGVLQAVIATKKGTTLPDESIVFGGHFDVVPQTVTAHYDNGSGTRMVVELARSYAKVKTRRSLVFALYNGEEEGALASEQMAADFAARRVKVSAYLGFDMVGIAWPLGPKATATNACLCLWRGARDEAFDALQAEVNHRFLKFPSGRNQVSIEGRNVRNSDEASWADAGFPTLRWAGLRTASTYPQYHQPADDQATIDTVAGGHAFFEQGLRNTLLSAYYTAAALDLK